MNQSASGISSRLDSPSKRQHLWLIGCLTFVMSIGVTIFVRYIFFPLVMPGAISPEGLLLATDSIEYHRLALEISERFKASGWSEWQFSLKKDNIMPGLLAAYYSTALPGASVAIFFAALVHALAAMILMRIMLFFTTDWRVAFIAASPYIFYPSAAFWYTQLLKDGYFNVGVLTFLLGWILLARSSEWVSPLRGAAGASFLIMLGYLIQAVIRPYTMSITLYLSLLFVVILTVSHLTQYLRDRQSRGRMALTILVALGSIAVLHSSKINLGYRLTSKAKVEVTERSNHAIKKYWQSDSAWLPSSLQLQLSALSGVRDVYITGRPDAKSMLDQDVQLKNPSEVVAYIPRALQIGLLAPFPHQWFEQGSTSATTIMRRVSMVEMIVTYAALLFLPVAIWLWRRRAEIWIAATYSLTVLTIYAIATPNIGTLYRVRYCYLMVLVAFGVLAICALWERWIRYSSGKERVSRMIF